MTRNSSWARLLPAPISATPTGGFFVLDPETIIVAPCALAVEAGILADSLRRASGFNIPAFLTKPDLTGKAIILQQTEGSVSSGYCLTVEPDKVILSAPDPLGIFFGLQTLLQLFPPSVFGNGPRVGFDWVAPCCRITDAPRFSWRGMMLDSARHFQDVGWIKKWIELLAQHKFNVFHWHLTDHQGWRVEIKKYPRLTEHGAWRKGTVRGHYFAKADHDGKPYGGFYTQQEIREVVEHARRHHITVVPEISMPGHCQAALAAYPELGIHADGWEVSTRWGGHPALFNVEPSTLSFLENVLEEILDLFPSRYIHIGGDEAACAGWEQDEASRARMMELGVRSTRGLYGWFLREINRFLSSNSRTMIGWDEITETDLLPDAVVMSWRGHNGGIHAAQAGQNVIMSPYQTTYFDYYQSPILENEPLGNRDLNQNFLGLEQVYGFEPIPLQLSAEEGKRILGIQGQLWTEYMPTPGSVEYMAFPRMCALAEVAWSPRPGRCFTEFQDRLRHHLHRLDCQDVRFRSLA